MKYFYLLLLLSGIFSCSNSVKQSSEKMDVVPANPLEMLTHSLSSDSMNTELLSQRAALYLKVNKIDLAFKDINRGLEINPNNPSLYLVLADIYFAMEQIDQCSASLMKASEIAPDDARAYVKLAELSLLLGNHNLARSFTDKALDISNFNPDAYYVRGMIFYDRNDTASALKNFLLAIDQDENHLNALLQIGEVYTSLRNPLAEDFLLTTVNRFPDVLRARYQTGLYYQEMEEFDKAIAHYDTILTISPDNKYALYNLGYINLVNLEKLNIALDYFERVLQVDPSYIDALYNKGRTLEEMGRLREAAEIYREVVRKKENYPLAIEALNRIDVALR
ncbi:MAG: tetratricopeptide repeat protein [Bacteroidales bacterium]|nr:tetratricopeptide repeat protein [Bacteroidales bacterium]